MTDPITRLRHAQRHTGGRIVVAGVDVFAEVERLISYAESDPEALRFLIWALKQGDTDEAQMWARDLEEDVA